MAIPDLRTQFTAELAAVRTDADLKALRDKYLGRKGGAVAGLMKALGAASADERPALGQQINEFKQHIETLLDVCDNVLGRAFCALGDGATSPITSGIKYFRQEFLDLVAAQPVVANPHQLAELTGASA